MKELNLHTLKDKIKLIFPVQCDYFVEGCILALENKGSRSELNYRARQKVTQTDKSDYLNIPVFIVVTEFGTPISLFIKK